MGNLNSKVRGDSPYVHSHPWSSAPCGSWVIRFSPKHPTHKLNKITEIKGLPIYHCSFPDWITGDIFNNLMFMVVQIFLEGNPNKLIRLIEEPNEAAEMIDQFKTFINSTNQDMRELQNQLFEAAHDSIQLHVEDEQLQYLDLLVTNDFDPRYELRSVLSRKNRSSKSSLLHSASSKIKSKLARFKNLVRKNTKGRQATHTQVQVPVRQPFPMPSSEVPAVYTPLRPTAPLLSELIERTETVTTIVEDYTDGFGMIGVSDNSNVDSTKVGDRERVSTEIKNAESMRNVEEKNVDLESKTPFSSLLLPSTSETDVSLYTSEQSLDEPIANQKGMCTAVVSQEPSNDIYSSFTAITENAIMLQPQENIEKEKKAGSDGCMQGKSSPNTDIHDQASDCVDYAHSCTSHANNEEEQHRRNSDSDCCNFPSGAKQAESNEHGKYDGQFCVPSGSIYVVPNEHSQDDGPICDIVPSDSKQAYSSEHSQDVGPICNIVPSDSKQAYSSEHSQDDGPICDIVPSSSKQAYSSEHSEDDGPVCADDIPGAMHAESNEDKENDSPVCNDVPPGTTLDTSSKYHNNDDPINAKAPVEKCPSNPCTFLPIYGLSKTSLRSKTQPVTCSMGGEGRCTVNVKEKKDDDTAQPQMPKPSSSGIVFLPFHGLTRGCFSPPQQGESTEAPSQKRKANMDEGNGVKLLAKRLKVDDTCETEDNSDPCHSSTEGPDCHSDAEVNSKCNVVDDTESDGGNDSSSTESIEWHDALEDVEP